MAFGRSFRVATPPGIADLHQTGGKSAGRWETDRPDERWVPTHCAFCGVQCGMHLRVADGEVVGVEPRMDTHNAGKLCPKGVTAYQQVHHPDRLTHPLVRDSDGLRRATWDEALDRVLSGIRRIQDAHGVDAVATYGGASMTTEKTYLLGKFARLALGTRHADYNGRMCMVSAGAANNRSFGVDRTPNPISDIGHTDLAMVIGANVPETFPIYIRHFWNLLDRGGDLPGDARGDIDILCDLARRLGRGRYFDFDGPRAVFEELRRASAGGKADYAGITYERLASEGPIAWPCPTEDHPGTPRMFTDGRFYTDDGRAHMNVVDYEPPAEEPDAAYPYRLTTGRTVAHYLSGNQTRRIGQLIEQTPSPWVEIHTDTAATLGISDGDPVRVTSRRGVTVLPARVAATIRHDTVFIPYHWAPPVGANQLTVSAFDPMSGIPAYKTAAVQLAPAGEAAYAVAPPPTEGAL